MADVWPAHPSATVLSRAVESRLRTKQFGRSIEGYEHIDSTNRRALEWAAQGAPHGAVVVAERQTDGRGRQGRTWSSDAGENLLFTIVLRTDTAVDRLPRIPLLAGLAVSETIDESVSGLDARLKWPNDVLIGGRKVAGILAASQLGVTSPVVVVGVGLNVNQVAFPDALADRATSLRLETGRVIPRASVLADLLGRLEARLESGEMNRLDAYRDRLLGLGTVIRIRSRQSDAPIEGVLRGVTDDGELKLEVNGQVHTFTAGDTTLHTQ